MSHDTSATPEAQHYAGGCHCGAVRFEVDLDLSRGVSRCNCTWCTKRGGSGVLVKPAAFRLTAGEGQLGEYRWGPVGTYLFCKHCGVQTHSRGNLPQLGGEYAGVNANCLDGVDPGTFKINYWDGRHDNWQAGPRDTPWPVFT